MKCFSCFITSLAPVIKCARPPNLTQVISETSQYIDMSYKFNSYASPNDQKLIIQ